jgi:hypothetical protein
LPTYGPSFHTLLTAQFGVADSTNNDVEVDGYAAGTGWDATTGLLPKVDGIVGRLIAYTSPGDAVARSPRPSRTRRRGRR